MPGSGRTLYVRLAADLTGFGGDMTRAGVIVDGFDRRVSTLGQTSGRSAGLLADLGRGAAKAGVAGLVVALGAAVSSAVGFEQAMRNVNSIARLSEGAFAATSGEVLALSRQVPQSAKTLAEGLYDVASAGFKGSDGMTVLRAAAVAATAGMTDTATAADAIVSILKAYGLSAGHAVEVSDALFKTVDVAKFTFGELAANIGDVVNSANAVGVPIQDVGAALATINLTGINAAESSTALARVLQSLLQPSEALAFTLHQLGYESGEQALETDGLFTVMNRLRGVTGQSATAVGELFNEIRANKGALALMAQEGRLYAGVQAQVTSRTEASGATQRAFTEQMKATAAEARLFRNAVTANLIEAGTKALPLLVTGMREVREAGADMGDVLERVGREVAPLLEDVWRVLVALADAVGDLGRSAGPTAAVLAALGGSVVIDGLEVLARLVANTAEFLADHEDAVRAVAIAYGLIKLGGVIQGLLQARAAAAAASTGLDGLSAAWAKSMTGTSASLLTFGSSVAKQGLIIAGVSAAVYGAVKLFDAMGESARRLKAQHEAAAEGIAASFDKPTQKIRAYEEEINEVLGAAARFGQAADIVPPTLRIAGEVRSEKLKPQITVEFQPIDVSRVFDESQRNRFTQLNQEIQQLFETAKAAEQQYQQSGTPLDESRRVRAVEEYREALEGAEKEARAYGATLGGKLADEQRRYNEQVAAAKANLSDASDGASIFDRKLKQVADSHGDVAAAAQADADALNAFSDAMSKTIRDQGSLASRFATGQPVFLSEHAALAAAVSEIGSVGSYVAEATKGMKAGTDEFRRAAERAIDRRADDLKAAAERAKGTSVRAFIGQFTADARQFTADLRAAIKAGFDPRFISDLAAKGPAQAGPLLRALVAENIGANKKMVGDYERTLTDVEQRTLKFARLNQRALRSESDQEIRLLPTAIKITTALEDPRNRTLDAVAKAAGTTVAEVRRIATIFGITIEAQERAQKSAQTQAGHLDSAATSMRTAAMGLREAAELLQPGYPGAMTASGGRRAADDIQAGYEPARPAGRGTATAPTVIVVPQSKVTTNNTTIEHLETQDPAAFARWQAQEARRRELLGL